MIRGYPSPRAEIDLSIQRVVRNEGVGGGVCGSLVSENAPGGFGHRSRCRRRRAATLRGCRSCCVEAQSLATLALGDFGFHLLLVRLVSCFLPKLLREAKRRLPLKSSLRRRLLPALEGAHVQTARRRCRSCGCGWAERAGRSAVVAATYTIAAVAVSIDTLVAAVVAR